MAVVLVVMEPGSEWPGHVGDAETLVALRSDQDMLAHTRERLHALERARQRVHVAVLACNGAIDEAAARRRAAVARELVGAVSRVVRGRLVLTARVVPGGMTLRQHLLALAGNLMDRLGGTSATVTLKFTDARDHERVFSWPRSGPLRAPVLAPALAV